MNRFLFFVFSVFLLASFSAQGRVSNEFVTVKASQEAIDDGVDLHKVYDALVEDSGKTLTVEIKYKDSNADCTIWNWFDYTGTKTVCEGCQGKPTCGCLSSMCTFTHDGSSSRKYIYTK